MDLMKVHPLAGITLQIRVHLASISIPLVGEQKYRCLGAQGPSWCNGFFLHCHKPDLLDLYAAAYLSMHENTNEPPRRSCLASFVLGKTFGVSTCAAILLNTLDFSFEPRILAHAEDLQVGEYASHFPNIACSKCCVQLSHLPQSSKSSDKELASRMC